MSKEIETVEDQKLAMPRNKIGRNIQEYCKSKPRCAGKLSIDDILIIDYAPEGEHLVYIGGKKK